MTTYNGFTEKRMWRRFRVNDIARLDFIEPRVFYSFKPSLAKSALIVDISRGGLSFVYEDSQMKTTGFDKLSVVVGANKTVVEDLPYQVISDDRIFPHHNATFARRCGVSFGELTPTQRHQLESFIRNYTTYPQTVDRRTIATLETSKEFIHSNPERREQPPENDVSQ